MTHLEFVKLTHCERPPNFPLVVICNAVFHGEKEDEERHPGGRLEDEELRHQPVHLENQFQQVQYTKILDLCKSNW